MQSLFLSDVELGKKDDDHHRSSKRLPAPAHMWATARGPPRKNLKRLLLGAVGVLALYVFIHNIPTDLGGREHRHPVYRNPGDGAAPNSRGGLVYGGADSDGADADSTGADADSADGRDEAAPAHKYNGKVQLPDLLPSLRVIASTHGSSPVNKNVLFVAATLPSMTALLPVACEMGMELRNYVHFAVMGRSAIDLEDLLEVNGIDGACRLIIHDARPDYAAVSTEDRMEESVAMALAMIDLHMHPQAIVVDGSSAEDPTLIKALRTHSKSSAASLIEVPEDGARRIGWLTKLDSAALSNWNKISVDILVHAYPGASGSLIRLLKSLSHADFSAGSVPHITIELPQKIDLPTEEFLQTFDWPPERKGNPSAVRQLSLRHRIPKHGISEQDSSIRFLESFWPASPQNAHVLVLSPQAELSSDFFHYVKYALLAYRYSAAAISQKWDKRLFSLSLELPATGLDGAAKLAPPTVASHAVKTEAAPQTREPTPFLWQAPNSNAVLFLGERWVELHSFVAQMLEKRPDFQSPATKLVSKKYPSWLEYALQLCQARGYWTLYPSSTTASALVTVHNELYQRPEEFGSEDESVDGPDMEDADAANGTSDNADEAGFGGSSLLESLPKGGSLPGFADLPLLSWQGEQSTLADMNAATLAYAAAFRREYSGCSAAELELLPAGQLFCLQDN